MDSRSQPRLEANEPVHVTVLGACDTKFLGRITHSSSRGIGILADQPAPLGSAVKVEWGHILLLGEVCHCRPEGDGYTIGLELEHALYHTEELARLAAILLE
jgi:PilZ domain